MAFTLDQIVPWGRSFGEYVRMFALTEADLEKQILGCGDGPASFNAAMRRQGRKVVSVDPLYQFSGEQILGRVANEVRVFPLLDHGGQPSPHVEVVCDQLDDQGYSLAIEPVGYEFQRGANKMLRAWR